MATTTSLAVRPRPVTGAVSTLPPAAAATMAPEAEFDQLMRLGETLASTGFLPAAVKNAAQAVAIILTGRELGIPPMHALRSIDIIKGKPALSAQLMLAIFHRAGGQSDWKHTDAERAAIWLKHPASGREHVETFTMADAKRAGLTDGDGWKKYPVMMLRWRAVSAGLRIVAPEIIAGMYTPEELGASVDADGAVVAALAPDDARPAHVTADGEVTTPPTLEEALAYPFPFQRGTANHGKPLADLPSDMLGGVAVWIADKQREKGDATWNAEAQRAIQVVLAARLREMDAAAAAGNDGGAPGELPLGETKAAPARGRVAQAEGR